MKYKIVKCDRCGKIQQILEKEELHKVIYDGIEHDYCEDCWATILYCHIKVNEVDKFIEEVMKKEDELVE